MTRPPIKIPRAYKTDRPVRLLLIVWRNLHLRHAEVSKRVNWVNPKAGRIEKKRRRQKWRLIAKILDTESTLLRMAAEDTQHPDLWTSSEPDAEESRRKKLRRAYDMNHRAAYNTRTPHGSKKIRAQLKKDRATLVRKIRDLERDWMVALFAKVHPSKSVPKPIPLHATELRPRKVKAAARQLAEELK